MDDDLRAKLATLPALSSQNRHNRSCKVCGAEADIFDIVDFFKSCSWPIYEFGLSGLPVYYYRCAACTFLFSDFIDDWSNGEIATFIYNEDYIKVDPEYMGERARRDASSFAEMFSAHRNLSILDYGSGTGVLADSLCKKGFDAESYDPFSSPHLPNRRFHIILCMEVIEHSPDPVKTLREMAGLLNDGGCIFVGTQLQPENIELERTHWWYVAPRNGHVSLQSSRSLVELGRAAGLICYPSGNLHGFAKNPSPVSSQLLKTVGRPTLNLLLSAPGDLGPQDQTVQVDIAEWHYLEDNSFRWTATCDVSWRWQPDLTDFDVNIRLPCKMEIVPGFLAHSKLIVNGEVVATKQDRQDLIASASVRAHGPVTICLQTPALPTPYDLRGFPDRRHLGLAVLVSAIGPEKAS